MRHQLVQQRENLSSLSPHPHLYTITMDSSKRNQKPTPVHVEGTDFKLPEVDMAYAATLKPSRVSNKNVMVLVTVVSGLGVSRSLA